MSAPSRSDLAVTDPVLTNFAIEYGQQQMVTSSGSAFGMTADFIFPQVSHTADGLTGEYLKFDINNRFQTPETGRAPGTDYNRIGWGLSSDTYRMEDNGLGWPWDDLDVSASFPPTRLEQRGNRITAELVMLAYERRVNTIVTTSGNYTLSNTNSAATVFGAQLSTASADLLGGVRTILKQLDLNSGGGFTGRVRCVTSIDVWLNGILKNDEIRSNLNIAGNQVGNSTLTPMLIGDTMMGVDLRINTTKYNSVAEDTSATFTPLYDFSDNMLFFIEPQQSPDEGGALGATFVKGPLMETFTWDEPPKGHVVAIGHVTDEKFVDQRFGYLVTNCLA